MVGAITARDILAHPVVTVRCFGWRVFFKALFAGHRRTFLSLLSRARGAEGAASRLSSLVDRCSDLELRAKRVYAAFAHAFADHAAARQFFATLAQQEQDHADLLALCSDAARRGIWSAECHNPWEQYLPSIEEHMQKAEAAMYEIGALDEALRLVIQVESAEINRVFQAVLASCDWEFVNRLAVFRRAVELHVSYIVDQLPKLDPRFRLASRELRALFPRTG
jgi:hypothetical protein